MKCTAKRRSWKLLPRTTLWLLVTEKTPSRPERMSLSTICDPGVFHSEIAGPRSLTPQRAQAPGCDCRARPRRAGRPDKRRSDCPRSTIIFDAGAVAGAIDKDAGVLVDQASAPSRGSSARGSSTSGAVTVMALPFPPPSTTRPARLRSSGRRRDHKLAAEDARRQMQRVAGRGMGERLGDALPPSHLDTSPRRAPSARRGKAARRPASRSSSSARADHGQTFFG